MQDDEDNETQEYECRVCRKHFGKRRLIFINHMKTKTHLSKEKTHKERTEKENCTFCGKSIKKANMDIHFKTVHEVLKPEKETKPTSDSKKRKRNKNPEVDDFDEEDFYLQNTEKSELIEVNICKSCDRKPKTLEKLLKEIDSGFGYILPSEKEVSNHNQLELCRIINAIRPSYHDNQLWMLRNFGQIKELEKHKDRYKCDSCTGTFEFIKELKAHAASVHEATKPIDIQEPPKTVPEEAQTDQVETNENPESHNGMTPTSQAINKIEPILDRDIYLQNIKIMAGLEKNNQSLVTSNQSLEKKNQNLEISNQSYEEKNQILVKSNQTYEKCNQKLVNKNQTLEKEVVELKKSINESADKNTKMIAEMERNIEIEIANLQKTNKACNDYQSWKKTQTSENEMEVLNQNLENKNQTLEKNNQNLERKNQSLEMSNQNLEKKTDEIFETDQVEINENPESHNGMTPTSPTDQVKINENPESHIGMTPTSQTDEKTEIDPLQLVVENIKINTTSSKSPKISTTNKSKKPKLFCSICQHQSGNQSNFRKHNQRLHGTKIKIFECDDCHHKFTTKQYLAKHIVGVHGGLKYICAKCNVELKTAPGLKKHLKNHDREINHGREILGM